MLNIEKWNAIKNDIQWFNVECKIYFTSENWYLIFSGGRNETRAKILRNPISRVKLIQNSTSKTLISISIIKVYIFYYKYTGVNSQKMEYLMFRLNNGKLKNWTYIENRYPEKRYFPSSLDYILHHMRNKRGFLKRKTLIEHLWLVDGRVFLGTKALLWYKRKPHLRLLVRVNEHMVRYRL